MAVDLFIHIFWFMEQKIKIKWYKSLQTDSVTQII